MSEFRFVTYLFDEKCITCHFAIHNGWYNAIFYFIFQASHVPSSTRKGWRARSLCPKIMSASSWMSTKMLGTCSWTGRKSFTYLLWPGAMQTPSRSYPPLRTAPTSKSTSTPKSTFTTKECVSAKKTNAQEVGRHWGNSLETLQRKVETVKVKMVALFCSMYRLLHWLLCSVIFMFSQ